MGIKQIYFTKRGDYETMEDYVSASRKNVFLELYCNHLFFGNTVKFNNCIFFLDDCYRDDTITDHHQVIHEDFYDETN